MYGGIMKKRKIVFGIGILFFVWKELSDMSMTLKKLKKRDTNDE